MTAVIDGTGTSTFPAVDGVTMLEGGVAMPRMVLATAQNTTSGTAIDFTGIPSWAKRITVMFNGVSLNGTQSTLIQIGSGNVDTTGYSSAGTSVTNATAATTSSTSGLIVNTIGIAAQSATGHAVLTLLSGNTWVMSSVTADGTPSSRTCYSAGSKSLSGALDRLRLTNTGSDTFDAGSVNIMYEG
jgi:hypothetical protein